MNLKDKLKSCGKVAAIGAVLAAGTLLPQKVEAQNQKQKKPNILVIFGDDIGISNISAYSDGLMGFRTPNIDRLAKEGVKFTDYYAENSCTAGRATFITGQSCYRTGLSKVGYADGMLEHDGDIGKILKALDDLGITENTIVIYTTDNGPNMFSWPDAAMSPFRSEKDSNWEGAFRVPCIVRWPGHIQAGQVSNEIVSGLDWFPTLLAAAGDSKVKEELLTGYQSQGTSFKVHLDGYNQLPYLTGQQKKSARDEFFYFNDDADLVSMRMGDWKIVYQEQRAPGNLLIWANPFTSLRLPKLFNLRQDPYERADITSDQYYDFLLKNDFLLAQSIAKCADFLDTFIAYPPSQDPASFSIDDISKRVKEQILFNRQKEQQAAPKKK